MFAAVAAIFMLISSGTSKTADYFKYSDCDFECSSRNISCVITEINPSYFPCECLVNADQCVSLAADDQVCLQPGASALGGSKIWPDFQRHKNETTTTTTHTSTTNSDVTTTTTHMTTTNSDVTTATPPHTDRDRTFIYILDSHPGGDQRSLPGGNRLPTPEAPTEFNTKLFSYSIKRSLSRDSSGH